MLDVWLTEDFSKKKTNTDKAPKPSPIVSSHWSSSNIDCVLLHFSSKLWDLDFQIIWKLPFIKSSQFVNN